MEKYQLVLTADELEVLKIVFATDGLSGFVKVSSAANLREGYVSLVEKIAANDYIKPDPEE
jgi:hypothetical protein